MFCSNCGKKIGDDAKFCDNCGNAIAVEQLGTNTSVKVSTKKANKKLPVILGVCVVVIILIAISISVLGKKADKVTKIVKAYENTINAESFNIHVIHSEGFRYIYEVFGKGDLEDTYIARYDIRGDFNDVKYNYEDYLDELAHGDYAGGYEYELLAKRDFAGLWDREFGDEIGLPYDTAYNFATDIASDYLKDRDNNTGVKVDIEDNRYSIYLETDELENVAEKSEYDDDVEEFLEELKESECQGVRCEVILEDEYIQSIALYFSRNGGEIQVIGIEFDSVNELTKETSMAYKLYNELSEETVREVKEASEELVQEEVVVAVEEVLPAYEKYINENLGVCEYSVYNLIYLDNDEVPELLYDSTADGRGTELLYYKDGEVFGNPAPCRGFGFYYIPRGNKVIYEGAWDADMYGTVAYLDEGTLISEHTYSQDYDMDTDSYMYSIDDAGCTKEEYTDFIELCKNGTICGWDTYSSIQEAYDNIGNSHAVEVPEQEAVTETYHDWMYNCSEFELNNQRLRIEASSFDIDLEISDDCVWQTRYSDGSVSDSSYDKLHRIWEESLETKEKLDEMGMEYESPEGLGVEVKDGKVVAVYMTAS